MKNTLNPDNQSWTEVRNADSEDGDFCRHKTAQSWITQLSLFVSEKLGNNPAIRVYAYNSGGSTYLAIDLFSQNSTDTISITVLMRGSGFYLIAPRDRQIDIELAGIVDSLNLIQSLVSPSHNLLTDHSLWISSGAKLAV